MTYEFAKQLHNEDEVTIIATNTVVTVLDAYVNPDNTKHTCIECDDGNTYYEDEIK